MTRDDHWQRLTDLFDRLLDSDNPQGMLAAEPDPELRSAALNLWRHHVRAGQEDYLAHPVEFEVTPAFQPGQLLLNRFLVDKLLGSGGMGEVYLAWDQRIEGWVAVKTIARLLISSRAIRERFVAEVRSARRVTHANVCRIHDLFEDGETVFFSMEYLEGTLLSDQIAAGPPVPQARAVVLQMAEALHAAHQTGVVHGDFKPANVMVVPPQGPPGAPPRAVIMDFGLARALDRAMAAPEQGLSLRAGLSITWRPSYRPAALLRSEAISMPLARWQPN